MRRPLATEPGSQWMDRMLAIFGSEVEGETWHDRGPGEGISESDWYLVDALPFERIEVPGDEAFATWTRLRREGPAYPVIVGDEEHLIRVAEQWGRDQRSTEEIIEASAALSHPEHLAACRSRWGLQWEPPTGDWPEDLAFEDDGGPSILMDPLTRASIDKAYILLIPAQHGYEVPAHLHFGGWNWCPPPENQVAVLRSWHERYGAELVSIGGDVLELRTATRPAFSGEALALAREQFDYCSDVLDQGYRDLATLAAALRETDWWYFWWD